MRQNQTKQTGQWQKTQTIRQTEEKAKEKTQIHTHTHTHLCTDTHVLGHTSTTKTHKIRGSVV